jgi:hypothetical protein
MMKVLLKYLKLTLLLLFAAPVFLFAQTGLNTLNKNADEVINDWPEVSREVAQTMIEKYGDPDGVTDIQLIWEEAGDWKRIVVVKEPIDHHFPMEHKDVVEQVIDYQVPVDKYDELAAYDGSVMAERTRGEISARCDKEGANYLAINLAHDIITGEKTVEEARQSYAENVKMMMEGEEPEYMQGFQFELPEGEETDPGEPIIEEKH